MKKNTLKRLLSVTLALIMLLSAIPLTGVSSFALTSGDWEYSINNGTATITRYNGSGKTVSIPSKIDGYSVTSIGKDAFEDCTSLTSVTIPNSVTRIGLCAFFKCTSLTGVTIPNSVTEIEGSAFAECTSLSTIILPDSIQSIGPQVFYNTKYMHDQNNWKDYVLYVSNHLIESTKDINSYYVVKAGTKSIAYGAFFDNSSLKSIILPDSLECIGDYSFGYTGIKQITIPKSVKKIGTNAFDGIDGLTIKGFKDSYAETFARKNNINFVDCEGQSEVSSSLKSKLQNKTSETIYDFCCDDFDGDGTYEAFAATSSQKLTLDSDSAIVDIWFINDISVTKIKSKLGASILLKDYDNNYQFIQKYEYKDNKFVVVKEWYTTGDLAYFWYVKNGQYVYDSKASGKLCFFSPDGDYEWFTGCHSTYDSTTSGSGHTWKPYYYYFDNGLKEYGGISITESQLAQITNGESVVAEVKKHGAISSIIARGNGIVNINYTSGGYNKNLTLLYCDNTINYVNLNYYSNDAFENAVDSGVYKTAYIPEIAVYPDKITQTGIKDTTISDGIHLFSDSSKLSVFVNDQITIGAAVYKDGQPVSNSNFSLVIESPDIAKFSKRIDKNGIRYFTVNTTKIGTTMLQFTDSSSGNITRVPLTVKDTQANVYTFTSIPTITFDDSFEKPCNIYNYNGMYVDGFDYDKKDNTVTFDVYNTVHIDGIVEVHDKSGNLVDAVLIEKFSDNNTSIKKAIVDNAKDIIDDFVNGNYLTYKQKTGYSKKTSVSISDFPKGGYLVITNDIYQSNLLAVVNMTDILFSIKGFIEKASKIKQADIENYNKKLTKKIILDKAYLEIINNAGKNGEKFADKLGENVGKEILYNTDSTADFIESMTSAIEKHDFSEVIMSTAYDMGWSIGESVFEAFAGIAGQALKLCFGLGEFVNISNQIDDLIELSKSGKVIIYQGGGSTLSDENVTVEQETNFDENVALKKYIVDFDKEIMDIIRKKNPELVDQYPDLFNYSTLYDISLIKDFKKVQPDGRVAVTIILDKKYVPLMSPFLKVYYLNDNNELIEMETVFDISGEITFYTDHFSRYMVSALVNYKEFPDVKEGTWYYDSVKYNSVRGYIMGYTNGKFGPNDSLQRQDFVCILARIAGADLSKYENKTSKLKDVKKGAYYAAAVNWAVDNNIISGYQNGNFGVGDKITREQIATILYRYKGSPKVSNVDKTLSKFKDAKNVSSFAKTPVAWAVQNNIISGMADGRVASRESASRAQIAAIIMRMDQQGMLEKKA